MTATCNFNGRRLSAKELREHFSGYDGGFREPGSGFDYIDPTTDPRIWEKPWWRPS